ncbi:hypothetical protein ACKAV7_000019 [Fusarium commune]
MACTDNYIHLDDCSYALQLKLEEIEAQHQRHSGKWLEDNPLDFALAFDGFEHEVNEAILVIRYMKLALSIANALKTDATAIMQFTIEEERAAHDREIALNSDENQHTTSRGWPCSEASQDGTELVDWGFVSRSSKSSAASRTVCSTVAGPSGQYALRQEFALEGLPQSHVECSACRDALPRHASVRLACSDIYCRPCLKKIILQAARDETRYPPKCHGQPIDLSIIESDLSPD